MLTFTTSLYILFALAAAAVVLSIWLLITNARVSGFFALLGGLVLAGVSAFMWTSYGGPTVSGAELDSAREKIVSQSNTIATLEQNLRKTDGELAALRRARLTSGADGEALRERLSEVEKQLAGANERAKVEAEAARREQQRLDDAQDRLRRLTRQLADETAAREDVIRQTSHQLDLLLERARRTREEIGSPLRASEIPARRTITENARRVELLDREIKRLGRADVPRPVAERGDGLSPTLRQLKDKMAYGFSTDDYEVDVFPDRELIGGQQGSYYVIDLKDAKSGVKFGFKAGKYTLDRSDRKFRKALSAFMRDVVQKLDGKANYRLMVRGSADAAAYRGNQDSDYFYRQISYLPQVGEGRYTDSERRRSLDKRIGNEDLPFLRARYLKDLVADVFPAKPASILQGNVSAKINQSDRNAELMLFVDW